MNLSLFGGNNRLKFIFKYIFRDLSCPEPICLGDGAFPKRSTAFIAGYGAKGSKRDQTGPKSLNIGQVEIVDVDKCRKYGRKQLKTPTEDIKERFSKKVM